jgi:hypothetical protein
MDDKKLIIPAEVKVCATCTYWDGKRRVDEEIGVVVVSENCHGECLIKGGDRHGLVDTRVERECMWDGLWPDDAPLAAPGSSVSIVGDSSLKGSVPVDRVHLGNASNDDPAASDCLPGSAPA